MKRLIALVQACLLAAGGIFAAHLLITDAQDEIRIYPAFEWGDGSLLRDRTLQLGFQSKQYLHWNTRYTFADGAARTEFVYGLDEEERGSDLRDEFDIYLGMNFAASTSHHFALLETDYGAMIREAAKGLGENGSQTVELKMKDYVSHYLPEVDIYYRDAERVCSIACSPHQLMDEDIWNPEVEAVYGALFEAFRFPVREEEVVEVSAHTSDIGLISSYEFNALMNTQLRFYGTSTAQGLYFLPVFQDEQGKPLAYESPAGHGLYFAPWKRAEEQTVWYGSDETKPLEVVVPDVAQAVLLTPIDPSLSIQNLRLDVEADRLWLLTRDEDSFDLQILTLSTGAVVAQTAAIPRDPDTDYADFVLEEEYILVTSDDQLALLDQLGRPLLTAPVERPGERYYIPAAFTPSQDALWFDGEHLILACRGETHSTAFWVCVYRQGKLLYHGEFDSSLTRSGEYAAHEGKMVLE